MDFKENELLLQRYRLLKLIGKGGFSVVWQALDEITNVELAIKIYAPDKGLDEKGVQQFTKEYRLTQPLNHPNLLKATHYDVIPELNAPFLVMPFCRNGSLTASLELDETVDEQKLAKLMAEVGSGLGYLHRQQQPIIHQDIKPDNILIGNDGQFMLTDFGISNKMRSTLRKSTVGQSALTVAYAPPEKYTNQGITEASDVFSLGIMLFECLTGDVPWGGDGGVMLLKGAHLPDLPEAFPDRLNIIIKACLDTIPANRPGAGQIEKIGVFFQQNGYWPKPEEFIAIPGKENPAEAPKSKGRKTEIIDADKRTYEPAASGAKTIAGPASVAGSTDSGGKRRNKAWIWVGAAAILVGVVIGSIFMFGGSSESPGQDDPLALTDSSGHSTDTTASDSIYRTLSIRKPGDSTKQMASNEPVPEKPENKPQLTGNTGSNSTPPEKPEPEPGSTPSANDLHEEALQYFNQSNYAKAFELFGKASDLGKGESSWYTGYLYRQGDGVDQNYIMALTYFLKAGNQGDPEGYNSYGYMYDQGLGVTENDERALEYYRKAAGMGLDLAQFNVGLYYDHGMGGLTRNWQEAFSWYRKSAEQGYVMACRYLGEFYLFGVGGASKSSAEAYKWFQKASAGGDDQAALYLEVLDELNNPQDLYRATNSAGDAMWIRPESNDFEPTTMSALGHTWGYRVIYKLAASSTIQIFPMYEDEREKHNITDCIDFDKYSSCDRLTEEAGFHEIYVAISDTPERAIGYVYVIGFVQGEDIILKLPAAICWPPQ